MVHDFKGLAKKRRNETMSLSATSHFLLPLIPYINHCLLLIITLSCSLYPTHSIFSYHFLFPSLTHYSHSSSVATVSAPFPSLVRLSSVTVHLIVSTFHFYSPQSNLYSVNALIANYRIHSAYIL